MIVDIDFNEPVSVQTIFRGLFPESFEPSEEPPKMIEKEYSNKVIFGWEDVKLIKAYPYLDDWKDFKGEKYYLTLYGYDTDLLILGSMSTMVKYWTILRTTISKPFELPEEDKEEY